MNPLVPSMFVTFHADGPAQGALDVTTSPAPSTATHSEVVGHDTAFNPAAPATLASVHAVDPPVGLLDVRTFA